MPRAHVRVESYATGRRRVYYVDRVIHTDENGREYIQFNRSYFYVRPSKDSRYLYETYEYKGEARIN